MVHFNGGNLSILTKQLCNYATSFHSYFLNDNIPYDIVFKIISQQGNEGEKGDEVFSPPTWIVPNWQKIPRVSACCLNLTEKENNNFHSYLVPKHQKWIMRIAHILQKLAFYIPPPLPLSALPTVCVCLCRVGECGMYRWFSIVHRNFWTWTV